jgi:four helix bundle protein
MNISQGSVEESRCYLFLCRDLNYADTAVLLSSLEEVSKLLDSYSKAILASVS